MTLTQLKHATYAVLKLSLKFEKAGKSDPALKPFADELTATWHKAYELEKSRALAEAERKDKGVVLWTVFQPAKYGGRRITTRTPNRIWTEEVGGLFASGAAPGLIWSDEANDLRRAMEEKR